MLYFVTETTRCISKVESEIISGTPEEEMSGNGVMNSQNVQAFVFF